MAARTLAMLCLDGLVGIAGHGINWIADQSGNSIYSSIDPEGQIGRTAALTPDRLSLRRGGDRGRGVFDLQMCTRCVPKISWIPEFSVTS